MVFRLARDKLLQYIRWRSIRVLAMRNVYGAKELLGGIPSI